ncbi:MULTISPECIES: helix-turn-helix domain-containing protein [Staphylococcus]|uniref:helix-turn-helix domain-containing protein n=1 Tax=Staphylococcus TaxID=1279 RepID=UPI0013F5D310|nr:MULTISPECIES: helix-turn-helix transcriptional regulator [Staphylococcus]MBA8771721.1 helix-turn-helix transcriptional regulator [Staphylococcus coagulans]NHC83135.1 helix-turn-helix transcriptional regulator [Staphylococcus aureus]NHC97362.1 helix-turn-helix transcriptional regulator [Staphylococcus aureus]NHE13577.1 helix-turn-helix transcriptional regulator [Staphylococcus aureus]
MIKIRLKEIMENRGLKISDLNEATGISRNSLSLLINGKSQGIQFDTLEKLVKALNIEPHDLFIRTFNYLCIDIKNKTIKNKDIINEYKIKKHPLGEHMDKIFQQDKKKVLNFSCKIDDIEFEYLIPYRILVDFNHTPTLSIEIDLKNYDSHNIFSYFTYTSHLSIHLLDYYIVERIFKLELDFIRRIEREFDLFLGHIRFYNDLTDITDFHSIYITKKYSVNRQDINYIIKDINENSLYQAKLENTLEIKSKNL